MINKLQLNKKNIHTPFLYPILVWAHEKGNWQTVQMQNTVSDQSPLFAYSLAISLGISKSDSLTYLKLKFNSFNITVITLSIGTDRLLQTV